MAYEGKWNKVSPGYYNPKKADVSTSLPKQQTTTTNWRREVPGHTSRQKTYLEKSHIYKEKTIGP
jgi:hypothetical protein